MSAKVFEHQCAKEISDIKSLCQENTGHTGVQGILDINMCQRILHLNVWQGILKKVCQGI